MGVLQDKLILSTWSRDWNLVILATDFLETYPLYIYCNGCFVVISNSSFLSLEGFVNGTEGMEDMDPVEQNLRQAIEEEKAK